MKDGGLILWNATAIYEMFKTSWQMGKHLNNGVSENHLMARSFRLAQWLNIIPSLRRTSQGSTKMVRKFYLEYSSDMLCSRRIWKGDLLVADTEELENLDASERHARRLYSKKSMNVKKE